MNLVLRLFAAFVFTSFMVSCATPPKVERKMHIHKAHGHQRVDYYHWLKDESRKDPEVLKHLNAENEFTDAYLRSTKKLQSELYNEMIGRLKEDDSEVPYFYKGYYYYSRTEKEKAHPIYCRRKASMTAPEEVMIDLNEIAKTKTNVTLGDLAVSPDQKILAYTLDEKGTEVYTLFFKELSSGKIYEDKVSGISPNIEWAGDNRHIFYTKMNKAFRHFQAYRYQLGDKTSESMIFQEADELFDISFDKTMDRKYLLMVVSSFTSSEVYFLDANQPKGTWRMVQKREPNLEYSVEHRNGYFYILNNKDAINFKVSRAQVRSPQTKYWVDFVKHDPEALLTGMHMQNDRFIYSQRKDGLVEIRYIDFQTKGRYQIEFNEPVYSVRLGANPEFQSQHLRLHFQSPITPPITYDYDFAKREFYVRKKKEVPNFKPNLYRTERVMVKARDGQMIPVTLLYSKKFQKNGEAPMLLYGYGSYGYTIDPYFRSNIFSLIDRGFVYAVAHIRGSQAKGRLWYEKGKLQNKMNTFNDFVDVAKSMVAEKYCNPEKLAIRGGSAGGLLMGAVVNQAPELFTAVVAQVPFVDVLSTILDKNLRFSTQEFQQWGNPNIKSDYDYILQYSPYDNVEKKSYPSILAIAGLNDSRVNYWEPAKWVAKLRDYTTSDHPILLRTQMEAGHQGSSGRYQAYKEEAEVYAFLLKELGLD
ncbi:MAG: S9 family peptidase [Bdellovibrionales bacterium]|nr:S9 family peptidase [Bdellovibrionales bacterium]